MSNVKVKDRVETRVQFVDTARELVVHTLRYAKKFPKSAMFLITKDISDLSKEVYKSVVRANVFFPIKSQLDVDERYKLLKRALGCLETLDCFLGIARDDYGASNITDYGWVHWGELMKSEENLIKKVLLSDTKVFSQ